nr:DUF6134 family protein [uncultured Dongia sp.]
MRSYPLVSAMMLLAVVMPPSAWAQSGNNDFVDPIALYGNRAHYVILRNGQQVGHHVITFDRQGDTTIVQTRADIEIPFLFLTGYRFDYQSKSVWSGRTLESLTATTDDDGDKSVVEITRKDKALVVAGPSGTMILDRQLLPTEHWSIAFVQDDEVLNTITGHVNRITKTGLASAFVPAANGIIRANRYRLDGDIRLETWYDNEGRWLGMRFAGEDGSLIEYRCRDCPAQVARAE